MAESRATNTPADVRPNLSNNAELSVEETTVGDFPTHQHAIEYDGDQLIVTSTMSVLDCDNEECRRRAEIAERGTFWNLDYIEKRIAEAQEQVRAAMDLESLWRLVLEAKQRSGNPT